MSIEGPLLFDSLKIEQQRILCRIKDSDIWLELDITNLALLRQSFPEELINTLTAWVTILTDS